METVANICNRPLVDYYQRTNFTDESIFRIIQDVALSLNDTMLYCEWRGMGNFCTALFQPILTEEGVCFSFNDLNSRDIYTEEYANESFFKMIF